MDIINRPMVGIIGAMADEVALIKKNMSVEKTVNVAGNEFFAGTVNGRKTVLVQSGMGKVNAGVCAQLLISLFGAGAVINTGVAGSLCDDIDIGDFVVSTDAVQHDFDVSPIGFAKGEIPYTGKYAFPADERLRKAAVNALELSSPDKKVFEGRICSGDQFITSASQKEAIVAQFGGLCCEMEGAAIAQVCYLNSTPFVIIRAVSDKVNGENHVDFATFAKEAAERCSEAVLRSLADI
ncbi:MAG: 5'-methylthioadenosine/adenosylhomocysteine nucleosidase [Clostridia bacterium]|nr:5'-methylthioadenosine/adenosylhomocysteine nucleosidase [Clostridia bacterium]